MGIISISFLVGDAAARKIIGEMIRAGFGWRSLFLLAAAVTAAILLLKLLFLHESRNELGYSEPEVNPLNVFPDGECTPHGLGGLLKPS